jgi:hypothetical protein
LRARPLQARPDRRAGVIWFIIDLSNEHEIETARDVGLVFNDPDAKTYLSLTARAEVRRDHAKAAAIWRSADTMSQRSERLRAARRAADRGALGRAVEHGCRRLRVRQDAAHRREAVPGESCKDTARL